MNLNEYKLDRYGDYLFIVHRIPGLQKNPDRTVLDDIVDELNDLNDRIARLETRHDLRD